VVKTLKQTKVALSKKAQKDLKNVPKYIVEKLLFWVDSVQADGLEEVRKNSGYHDEPLKGDRKGQRSIRLNQAYRAFYIVENGAIQLVEVIEVNKHKY